MRATVTLSFLGLCLLPCAASPARALQVTEVQSQEPAASFSPPGTLQIIIRAQALADSVTRAEQAIQELAVVEGVAAEIADAERRHVELQALLASMIGTDFVRLERLSRLHDQVLLEDSRLGGIRDGLTATLAQLGEEHARWVERRQLWRSWLDMLREEPDSTSVEPEITMTLEGIEGVLALASGAASGPLSLQGRIEVLRDNLEQLGAVIATTRERRREVLWERTQPILFSREHLSQLADEGWRAWNPTTTIDLRADAAFLRGHLGLLGLHTLLALLIVTLVRVLRPADRSQGPGERSELLSSSWALGVFVSVVVAMTRITLAPPLWDVLLWTLFGGAAAILSRQLFRARALQLTVFLLAVFYPVFLLLEVARLPDPVFRVGLAAVAACAIPLFLLLARNRNPTAPAPGSMWSDPRRSWLLRIGAGAWILVLFAVMLGFDALARWFLHATVMSAAVAFTIWLGFACARAAITAIDPMAEGGSLMRRAGVLTLQRVIAILRIALLVGGGLILLDAWGIVEAPVATWQGFMNAGFTVGTLPVTLGRVLSGSLVVYLAVLLSGLVRSLLASGSDSARAASHGFSESISGLAHYALVALGTFLALAVVGVKLQNFAIIVGALGIGVGFGLQNVVNNFASGLILLFERPVRVGDTVVVGDVWGTIRKIGLRSTIMVTLDQSEMIVPNGDLVAEKVINWTLSSPIARISLPVGVAYGSPVGDVLRILEEAAFAHDSVLKDPPPRALFTEFGDSALDFELRVWINDVRARFDMRSALLSQIDRRLREAGIEIPFPQRDLHLRSIDCAVALPVTRGRPSTEEMVAKELRAATLAG